MARFYRVFGTGETCPPQTVLPGATFGVTDGVWFWAELPGIRVERFEVTEEGIRGELNSWAAVVEATLDEPAALMERVIQSQQLFTVAAEQPEHEPQAEQVARALASATSGCYQADEGGWHEADGTLLAGDEEVEDAGDV